MYDCEVKNCTVSGVSVGGATIRTFGCYFHDKAGDLYTFNSERSSPALWRSPTSPLADAPAPVRWVVVAAEPVTDVDITAADALAEIDAIFHKSGMELCFAEMKGPVKDRQKRYGLFGELGGENFFPTIGEAVDRYVEGHNVAGLGGCARLMRFLHRSRSFAGMGTAPATLYPR